MMSAETAHREGCPGFLPLRRLWNWQEAAFDAVFGLLLVLFGFAGAWLWSRSVRVSFWALAGLIFGMASFNRGFAYLAVGPFYITELVLGALLALAPFLLNSELAWLPRERLARRIVVGVALYLAYGLLRLAPSLAGGTDVLELVRAFALVYYALFGLLAWLILQPAWSLSQVGVLFVGTAAVATVTNTYFAVSFILNTGIVDDPYVKVTSGHAALFSLFAVAIVVAMLLHNAFQIRQRAMLLAAAVAAMALNAMLIFMSGHRSALLALILSLAAVLFSGRKRVRLSVGWTGAAAAFAVVSLSWGAVGEYVKVIFQKYQTVWELSNEPNAAWRMLMWLQLVTLWTSAPVCGVGFAYDFGAQDPWGTAHALDKRIDPHNSYVALLCRTGIIGFCLLAFIMWNTVLALTRLKRRIGGEPQNAFVVDCLLGCFVAISVYASMNVTLETPYHGIFFWLFVGITALLADGPKEAGR
jgi:O-antigen ligase